MLPFLGCNKEDKKVKLELEKEKISKFRIEIFNQEKIDSRKILSDIIPMSDSISENKFSKNNTSREKIYFTGIKNGQLRFFENPKRIISAIGYYENGVEVIKMEYFNNGQAKCRFSLTDDGIKNGPYFCFKENGQIWLSGYFDKGLSIQDSLKKY